MQSKNNKRFSIRLKLLLIFGTLIVVALFMLALISILISRKAVLEKINEHLIDKADSTAQILNTRITSFFHYAEGIARSPVLHSGGDNRRDIVAFLTKEVKRNPDMQLLAFVDRNGVCYLEGGRTLKLQDREWFKESISGKNYISTPYVSRSDSSLIITVSVPIYNDKDEIVGVLMCDISGMWLSERIKDLLVGKTGVCYVIDNQGVTVADPDEEVVRSQENSMEKAKKDASYASMAAFERRAINEKETSIGEFIWENEREIAAFAKIECTGWAVILSAPSFEFLGTISTLQTSMYLVSSFILLISLAIVYIVTTLMVRPIKTTVNALQDIAMGEGDLTVRLPISGNDEVTDLSLYFNETIAKIGSAIKTVSDNAHVMEEIGDELTTNMSETASSVHEISSNIESIKVQAVTQARSVSETASTMEEISKTIKSLNSSIESQAASVAVSSSSIEEMVANIASITSTLEKSDGLIKELGQATQDGKETLTTSNSVTHKIAEESGSLMEASSVIQHIASQTNLLAMNAAIEAAHAGEAGKGFAVVADEIRKLAEESAAQGKTITATLKSLSGEIEGLSGSSKVVETKFNAIFNLAEEVKNISARLTEAMREQEHGSREVLTAIKDINHVTSDVQEGSTEMLRGSEGVAREMEKLDGLTRVITDSMNEMAAGATQISNAVQEVAEITQKNKMSIDSLVQEVHKFKV